MAVETQECPDCGAEVVTVAGFAPWCPCGWNLRPRVPAAPRTLFDQISRRLSVRAGDQLATQAEAGDLGRRWSPARVAGMAMAGAVHALTFAAAVGGVALIVWTWPSPFGIVGGLLALALGWVLRPRPGKVPKGSLGRDGLPVLFGLCDEVTKALAAEPIDGIVIRSNWNASFGCYGWRRRRILQIGLPFWTVLDPQERVALLGHEIGHNVNGDSLRGLYVGGAIRSLGEWYALFMTRPSSRARLRPSLMDLVSRPVLRMLSWVPWVVSLGLVQLFWRDSQRAEYLADRLSAEVGGTDAALGVLDKVHLDGTIRLAVQHHTLQHKTSSLLDDIRDRASHVPASELERIHAVESLPGSRVDSTHPPTAFRRRYLLALPAHPPSVECDPSRSAEIDVELARFASAVEKNLVDSYLSNIYR